MAEAGLPGVSRAGTAREVAFRRRVAAYLCPAPRAYRAAAVAPAAAAKPPGQC